MPTDNVANRCDELQQAYQKAGTGDLYTPAKIKALEAGLLAEIKTPTEQPPPPPPDPVAIAKAQALQAALDSAVQTIATTQVNDLLPDNATPEQQVQILQNELNNITP